jgi:hypothetical protein
LSIAEKSCTFQANITVTEDGNIENQALIDSALSIAEKSSTFQANATVTKDGNIQNCRYYCTTEEAQDKIATTSMLRPGIMTFILKSSSLTQKRHNRRCVRQVKPKVQLRKKISSTILELKGMIVSIHYFTRQ